MVTIAAGGKLALCPIPASVSTADLRKQVVATREGSTSQQSIAGLQETDVNCIVCDGFAIGQLSAFDFPFAPTLI